MVEDTKRKLLINWKSTGIRALADILFIGMMSFAAIGGLVMLDLYDAVDVFIPEARRGNVMMFGFMAAFVPLICCGAIAPSKTPLVRLLCETSHARKADPKTPSARNENANAG
ncbi:MAG: hypothetical protein ACFHHU_00105 [Porticoccaceae bacterium]